MIELSLIFLVGLAASFIGALVGGGGLITIPFLTLLGMPPQLAIATNKLGGLGGCIGGLSKYWQAKKINWRFAIFLTLASLPASYLGNRLLIAVNTDALYKVIGIIILLILPLIIFQNKIQQFRTEVRKRHIVGGYFLYAVVSVYSGFFGAGTGIFSRFILMFLFKKGPIESNAVDLVPGFICNVLTVAILGLAGYFNPQAAGVLFVGMLIGGYFGAHAAIKSGDKLVRVFFVILAFVMSMKLLFFS